MRIVICGAGRVGSTIAEYLAQSGNDVVIIDKNQEKLDALTDAIDARPVLGFASHPSVLQKAQAQDADMLIAVTESDEVNIIACEAAEKFFNVPTKIARIRSKEYTGAQYPFFAAKDAPIDVVISPEVEIARSIRRSISYSGAFDVLHLAGGVVRLIGIHCDDVCPMLNTPLRQLSTLFPDLHAVIVGIVRQGELIIPSGDSRLSAGDDVYVAVQKSGVRRLLSLFGYDNQKASGVLILGGGQIALHLAAALEKESDDMRITIIEKDEARAEALAESLKRTIVIHGDFLDTSILEEAGIEAADTVVALTSDDENNILSSLTAKKYGATQTLTMVEKTLYAQLVTNLGVDVVIDPKDIIVSTILQHVRRGKIYAAYSLRSGLCEVLEADVFESFEYAGEALRDVRLPSGVIIGAIVRKGESVQMTGDTVIEVNDRLILFAEADAVKQVEKMFSVGVEFF